MFELIDKPKSARDYTITIVLLASLRDLKSKVISMVHVRLFSSLILHHLNYITRKS